MRALLLCLALTGCAHPLIGECVWGAKTEARAAYCAEKNFGKAGKDYLTQRWQRCAECGTTYGETIGATPQWCALNCPDGGE